MAARKSVLMTEAVQQVISAEISGTGEENIFEVFAGISGL
jgi:hypothetical protein